MLKEIEDHREQIAELCRHYGVRRLEIFGSAARAHDFDREDSDIDFLVECSETRNLSFTDHLTLQDDLTRLLRHKVQLAGRKSIMNSRNHIRRNSILRDLEVVYG